MTKEITYRHNVMRINSIESFLNIKSGFHDSRRDVYFVRGIGEPANFMNIISEADKKMGIEMDRNHLQYIRMKKLPQISSAEDVAYYSECYDVWALSGKIILKRIHGNQDFFNVVSNAYRETIKEYVEAKKNATKSMIRNFATKLLFWLDLTMNEMLKNWNEKSIIKIISENIVKDQEYLFFYFLTLMGCDVLLLENQRDAEVADNLRRLSYAFDLGPYGSSELDEYVPYVPEKKIMQPKSKAFRSTGTTAGSNHRVLVCPENNSFAAEKSFEELAQLASSIVMIVIHDRDGAMIGTGSGIMIGKDGYILTNNHVASGGRFYSVRIEDDEEVYPTDEIIKYNSSLDLAIIRIDKRLQPLPIYRGGKKLVRGQKVVAIGSPLGLFNSVSDGIISGFRNIRDVDMIQFTAPISHGSSGGAVLNMQGEVVGISTAGMDNGQNLNLAVSYENILMFANGFIDDV